MPRRKLTHDQLSQVLELMRGLSGSAASATADRLASQFGVTRSAIYEASESVRPARKRRKDAGRRVASLTEHPVLRFATMLVVTKHLDPAMALEAAQLNGASAPVSLETFLRYLREQNLSAKTRKVAVTPHRRFQAEYAGQIFQGDWSALKERWMDPTTRRILRIPGSDERNHPERGGNRERVWICSIVDDYSRRLFLKCIVGRVPTQLDTLEALKECGQEFGDLCRIYYSDNGGEQKAGIMRNAARCLNIYYAECGGFELRQHSPRNSRASGKVENTFKVTDKYARLLGLVENPSLDELNAFFKNVAERKNHTVHRETGEKPIIRWRSGLRVPRAMPPTELDAVLRAQLFEGVVLRPDMTVAIEGARWQVPHQSPFVEYAKARVNVLFPVIDRKAQAIRTPDDYADAVGWMVVTLPDQSEWKITRRLFAPDVALDFKGVEESATQQIIKALGADAANLDLSSVKVPGFHVPFAGQTDDSVVLFPARQVTGNADNLGAAAMDGQHPPAAVVDFPTPPEPENDYSELLDLVSARRWLLAEGLLSPPISDQDVEWLCEVFNGRVEISAKELRAAFDQREHQRPQRLALVR